MSIRDSGHFIVHQSIANFSDGTAVETRPEYTAAIAANYFANP
jgi:hypothetical protein